MEQAEKCMFIFLWWKICQIFVVLIFQYGKALYDNYIGAVQKAELASRLAKPGNTKSIASGGSSSKGIQIIYFKKKLLWGL